MSEIEKPQTPELKEVNLASLLSGFQGRMREYDSLESRKEDLELQKYRIEDSLNRKIDLINPENAISYYSRDTAYEALHMIMINKRIGFLDQDMKDIDSICSEEDEGLIEQLCQGRKLALAALSPDTHPIHAFSFSSKLYYPRTYDRQTGLLYDINLDPRDGGSLQIRRSLKRGKIFQAYPLFDKFDGYRPLFDVKLT